MYTKEIQRIKVDFNETLCEDFLGMTAVYHGYNYNKEYEMRGYTFLLCVGCFVSQL